MPVADIYSPSLPPVVEEAALCPLMTRLRDVGMDCGCQFTRLPVYRDAPPYTRYTHSVGTARIVWNFTRDITQTLAALLHDVATPAFAHTVDFLRGDYLSQSATEEGTAECIRADGRLAGLLAANGIAVEAVCDYHLYPIADNPSPHLSADRLEYTLGNLVHFGFRTEDEAAAYYRDIALGESESGTELVFRHADIAEGFALETLRCSRVYVSDGNRYTMQLLAECLRDALERGVLEEAELHRGETDVLCKLSADARSRGLWNRISSLTNIVPCADPADPDARVIDAKKRYIDPFVEGIGRVSSFSAKYRAALEGFLGTDLKYPVAPERNDRNG